MSPESIVALLVGLPIAVVAVGRLASRHDPLRPPRRVRERDAYELAALAGQRATVSRGARLALDELGH